MTQTEILAKMQTVFDDVFLDDVKVTPELNANGCTRGPWSRPAAGTFGNVALNSFFGPHFFNADASYWLMTNLKFSKN